MIFLVVEVTEQLLQQQLIYPSDQFSFMSSPLAESLSYVIRGNRKVRA